MTNLPPDDGKKKVVRKKVIKKVVRRPSAGGAPLDQDDSTAPDETAPETEPGSGSRFGKKSTLLNRLKKDGPPSGSRPSFGGGQPGPKLPRAEMPTPRDVPVANDDYPMYDNKGSQPPSAEYPTPADGVFEDMPPAGDDDNYEDFLNNLPDPDIGATVIEELPVSDFDIFGDDAGADADDVFDESFEDDFVGKPKGAPPKASRKTGEIRSRSRGKKKSSSTLIVFALLLMIGAGGYWAYTQGHLDELIARFTPPAPPPPPPPKPLPPIDLGTTGTPIDSAQAGRAIDQLTGSGDFVRAVQIALDSIESTGVGNLKKAWTEFVASKSKSHDYDQNESTIIARVKDKQTEIETLWKAGLTADDIATSARIDTARERRNWILALSEISGRPPECSNDLMKSIENDLIARLARANDFATAFNHEKAIEELSGVSDWGPLADKVAALSLESQKWISHRKLMSSVVKYNTDAARGYIAGLENDGVSEPWMVQVKNWLTFRDAFVTATSLFRSSGDDLKKVDSIDVRTASDAIGKVVADVEALGDNGISPVFIKSERDALEELTATIEKKRTELQQAINIQTLRDTHAQANEAWFNNDYSTAVGLFKDAIEARNSILINYLPEDLGNLSLEFKLHCCLAKRYAADMDFDSARAELENALNYTTIEADRNTIKTERERLDYQEATRRIDGALQRGEGARALELSMSGLSRFPNDSGMKLKRAMALSLDFPNDVLTDDSGARYLRIPPGVYSIPNVDAPYNLDRLIFASEFELTGAQYDRFLADADETAPLSAGEYADYDRALPITNVTLREAKAYCAWLTAVHRKIGGDFARATFRLPTTEEWSVFSLSAGNTDYPWGDWDPAKIANSERGTFGGRDAMPFRPGSFPDDKSVYGVYDVCGNVSEWVDTDNEAKRQARGGSWQDNRLRSKLSAVKKTGMPMAVDIGVRIVIQID
ncbi:MAG: SUMF1/EgtB/PvdO family nonheme iron enzyme [Planctomycetota bacterium]